MCGEQVRGAQWPLPNQCLTARICLAGLLVRGSSAVSADKKSRGRSGAVPNSMQSLTERLKAESREAGTAWEAVLVLCRGGLVVFAALALAHAALVLPGYCWQDSVRDPSATWPSRGLAFAV